MRVCPFYGILEILASNVVVWTTKVATVDGPICLFCERYVSRIYRTTTNSCVSCEHNYITTLFPPTPRILDIPKKDVPRKNKTLVFLCARLSAGNTLTVGYFDKLVASLEQSESNPGRFGKFNRPGLPAGMEIVGKFVARATATTKIDTRYERTINAEADWLPMNLLPEFIVHRYWPGNTVLIGMSTPSCLTVSPNHLVINS
ncbi:uncharacterized protein LOC124194796 [Daphnia pulex]|uniref:uncharacterized protein LOC124194796 n=1 Tax=Daphnia pulex TaxID=6669 RepID=UPI001EDDE617|nr:uncharacterized protein LOC124194796 [Daphnia pulex]